MGDLVHIRSLHLLGKANSSEGLGLSQDAEESSRRWVRVLLGVVLLRGANVDVLLGDDISEFIIDVGFELLTLLHIAPHEVGREGLEGQCWVRVVLVDVEDVAG